ncbi:MAG: ABC transporter ATP-binding protein [Clostridia bacterium]|nr:ABC transporter ATP-binding protein [Clostridia bacterium]
MLKKFISYYKPYKKMLALDMLASLLISLIGMIYPVVTNEMLGTLIPDRKYRAIVIAGIIVLLMYIVRFMLRYFVQYYGHIIGVKMQAQMRRDLFAHLQKLPFSFYDEHETGKILTRMTSDLFDVSELAHHGPENLLISLVMLIGSFVYLCTINVYLTLIIFACVPFLIAVAILLRKRMRSAFDERRATTAIINASIESSISGIRVTKAFTNSEKEKEKFEVGNNAFVKACHKAYHAMALFFSSTSFITDIFNVIILIAGGLFLYDGAISFAEYSAFIVSVNLFINPITTLINFMEQYQQGLSGFARYVEIMEIEPEEDDGKEDLGVSRGEIEFKNVDFSYGDSNEVLHSVSLKVTSGKTLALVGASGGGKTTVCHLIPRFYNLSGGEILIDGKNVNDLTLESLRRNVGIVQQDVFLFNGTIRENIVYGRLDATEEEIIEAAKLANIHEWVMGLEDGYDTQIGERGVKLSGGQKQRLSIARVFLKNPPILILDEATSALDNTTEILIQESLDKLSHGRTTIVVAHRLSTVRRADEIAVIEDGMVTERGSHEELLEKNGTYKRLHALHLAK